MQLAQEVGIRIVTFPGDGDTTLRHLQWNLYLSKRQFIWLTGLRVPLQCLYSTNGKHPSFPMQDLCHVLKKICNSMKRTETKCLMLGVDPDREKQLCVRWDFIFECFGTCADLLVHCRLSAVLMSDRQDPSLSTDLSSWYMYFF